MSRVKIAVAFLVSIGALAFAAAPGQAANHFLTSPVPVQPAPLLDSNLGVFDFDESGNGEAVAFWGQSNGMWAAIRPADGGFAAPVQVTANGSGTSLPQVAMAPSGYTIVVWRESVAGKEQVMAATRQAGATGFGAPVQVSLEAFSIPATNPDVDIADNGDALIVWTGRDINGDPLSTMIRKRYIGPGGSSPVANVSVASPAGNIFPGVAVGPNGHSLIDWVIGDTVTGDPATQWAGPGGVTPDVQVFDTNSGSSLVAAVDSAGTAVIANNVGTDVIGNHREPGVGKDFLFDQSLKIPGTNNAFRPQIGMDAAGRATVAFSYFKAGKDGIQSVDRPAGGDTLFGTTTNAIAESADVTSVALAVGGNGLAMLGWVREDGRVYAAARDGGSNQFGAATGPISPANELGGLKVSTDAQGKGIVAFSNSTAPAEDFTISALPYDDVPTAQNLSIPATAVTGQTVSFSVGAKDAWAAVSGFEWTLDAGVVKSGGQVSHIYTTPGERTVKVKLTDAAGNTNTVEGKINVTAKPVPPDKIKPKVTGFKVRFKKARAKKKNAFLFKLSERAKVVIKAKKISGKGRGQTGTIVKKSKGKGRHAVNFRKKIGKRKLRPGTYKATIVATDKAGNRSKPRRLKFRIIG